MDILSVLSILIHSIFELKPVDLIFIVHIPRLQNMVADLDLIYQFTSKLPKIFKIIEISIMVYSCVHICICAFLFINTHIDIENSWLETNEF